MLGTYPDVRALPWRVAVPRRRLHRHALRTTTSRQALRHGVNGAVKTACLTAAMLAASGMVGTSRVPIVLSDPSQPAAAHASAATAPGVGLAARVTTR
jgi:hypothetical protein